MCLQEKRVRGKTRVLFLLTRDLLMFYSESDQGVVQNVVPLTDVVWCGMARCGVARDGVA
jgi:hypothetical protein